MSNPPRGLKQEAAQITETYFSYRALGSLVHVGLVAVFLDVATMYIILRTSTCLGWMTAGVLPARQSNEKIRGVTKNYWTSDPNIPNLKALYLDINPLSKLYRAFLNIT